MLALCIPVTKLVVTQLNSIIANNCWFWYTYTLLLFQGVRYQLTCSTKANTWAEVYGMLHISTLCLLHTSSSTSKHTQHTLCNTHKPNIHGKHLRRSTFGCSYMELMILPVHTIGDITAFRSYITPDTRVPDVVTGAVHTGSQLVLVPGGPVAICFSVYMYRFWKRHKVEDTRNSHKDVQIRHRECYKVLLTRVRCLLVV